MMTRFLPSLSVVAFLALMCPASGLAQETSASLSVQGRPTVYNHVVALRGKSLNDPRIIVIATVEPLTAKQFEQVVKANAEDTMTLEGYPSYIKASFKEDGTLRYLVGDGGGAVFSKKNEPTQDILKGQATVSGDRVSGEVTLDEPGEYSKVAKLTFDLPILTEAPAAE
ncbi:MAG: hypothetical protein IAE97_00410 [Chthoniobacterales bacterium]|nr:hypothetical protein [Chthoniobacterales bacterium]